MSQLTLPGFNNVVTLIQYAYRLAGVNNGVSTGDNMLETSNTNYVAFYPYELTAERVWRPVYFDAEGETIKLSITMTDDLMLDPHIRESKFEMHAMMFNARPSGRLQ